VGDFVGDVVGRLVGDFVGLRVGNLVGDFVGNAVGAGDVLGGAVIGGTVCKGISRRLLTNFTLGFLLVVPVPRIF